MAGYSGTPLVKKLGIKPGFRVRTTSAPEGYSDLLGTLPADVTISSSIRSRIDLWHFFTKSRSELESALPQMMRGIHADAAIWVSWPKKTSGIPSTVDGDTIRELALPLGLVDIKICAVDDTWSALKLVIRKELRPSHGV
ncbi:MAG: DUF3052 family protein [Woeseiaceae bacterium]|nr:DUF3052 family protein [Woeseiaceae bacterium]